MTGQPLTRESTIPATTPFTRLLATTASPSPALLRATLALVMFPHGAQKVFGWFGGYGWDGTIGFLTGPIGLPWIAAAALILLELLGPVLLLLGLATRAVALGFVAIMVGAIATVHAEHGFFMNWSGTQAGEGYEFHLLVIGASLALVLAGGGRWSMDRRLASAGAIR